MAIKAINELTEPNEMSYNGVEFFNFRNYRLTGEFVYDEAGWAVTHTRYKLEVSFTDFGDDEADMAAIASILRTKLNEPGRQLIITAVGLGDLVVNSAPEDDDDPVSATTYDVEWGPKPHVISITPIGGVQAIEVVWECEFSVNECAELESSQSGDRPLLALNYKANYRIANGLTTRTCTGYALIPLTRAGGLSDVINTVDSFWDRFTVPTPYGFKRQDIVKDISADRRRLDFTFVDTQLPNEPYPPQCIDASGELSIGNEFAMNFETWKAELEASYEVAPGRSKSFAAAAFYALLLDVQGRLVIDIEDDSQGSFVMLERIAARNVLYTNKAAFAATFKVVGCLKSLLGAGTLWQPVNSNYTLWAASIADVWSNRGTSRLQPALAGAIIDLCNPITTAVAAIDNSVAITAAPADFGDSLVPEIPPDSGWIAFDSKLITARSQNIDLHNILESYDPSSESAPGDDAMAMPAVKNASNPEIQTNGGPTDIVVFVGKAMRAKYPPIVPRLTGISVGGGATLQVVESKRFIDGPHVIGCYLGAKVSTVRWAIAYLVQGYVNQIPDQPRPIGCCDDAT